MLRILLVCLFAFGLSGCLAVPVDNDLSPCEEETVAPDGTVIPPGEPYWTLTTDQVPIPDGQQRVDEIPGPKVRLAGRPIEAVTRDAVVDGEDWMDRRWACHLSGVDVQSVEQDMEVVVSAGPGQAEQIRVAFHYRHPDGLDIGYAPEPDWSTEGSSLSERMPAIREGRHDVFVTIAYPEGLQRRDHFVADFQTEG